MKNTLCAGILLCSFFLLTRPSTSIAQKKCDLSISIVSPEEGAEFEYGDTARLMISIKNLGPDVVDSSDGIYTLIGGGMNIPHRRIQSIAVGDSVVYSAGWEVNFQDTNYFFNTCIFFDKSFENSINDTIAENDTACVNILFKGRSTKIAGSDYPMIPLTLYPNPASDQVMLSWHGERPEQINIIVRDITGRHLFQKAYGKPGQGNQTVAFDISALLPGIYFVEWEQGAERRVGKLMVQ